MTDCGVFVRGTTREVLVISVWTLVIMTMELVRLGDEGWSSVRIHASRQARGPYIFNGFGFLSDIPCNP